MKKTLFVLTTSLFFGLAGCKPKPNNTTEHNPSSPAISSPVNLVFTPNSSQFKIRDKGINILLSLPLAEGESPQAKFFNNWMLEQINSYNDVIKYQSMEQALDRYGAELFKKTTRDSRVLSVEYQSPHFIALLEAHTGENGDYNQKMRYLDLNKMQEVDIKKQLKDEIGLRKLLQPLLKKEMAAVTEYSYTEGTFDENGIFDLAEHWFFDGKNKTIKFSYDYARIYDLGDWEGRAFEIPVPIEQVQPFLSIQL